MITQNDINITDETNALWKISLDDNLLRSEMRENQHRHQCDMLDRLGELNSALDKQIYALAKQGNAISEKISDTAAQNTTIAERTSAIAELKAILAERSDTIAELRAALIKQATIVAAIQAELRAEKALSKLFTL